MSEESIPPRESEESPPLAGKEPEAENEVREKAKAQAMLAGMSAQPSRAPRWKGCGWLIYLIMLGLWGGLAALIWYGDPSVVNYEPRLPGGGNRTDLGKGYSVALPAGWTVVDPARHVFSGPGDIELGIQHSSVRILGMFPRSMSGVEMQDEYTAVAYANSLARRLEPVEERGASHYFTVGDLSGAEAEFRMTSGETVRGFAVVDGYMRVLELLFTIPAEADGHEEAVEAVIRTLRFVPEKRRKPVRRKALPEATAPDRELRPQGVVPLPESAPAAEPQGQPSSE